jgi:hypothetical protein
VTFDKIKMPSAINAVVGIIASRIDLITAREVLNKNVGAINEVKSNIEQMQRDNERYDIEVRYNESHPPKLADINPDYIGHSTA